MERRTLIKASMALASLGLPGWPAFAATNAGATSTDSEGKPFDFNWLQNHACGLSKQPYQDTTQKVPEQLAKLRPLDYQRITYRPSKALWAEDPNADVRLQFFHIGMHFNQPVRMHTIDRDTRKAREIHFSPELFDYEGVGIDPKSLEGNDLGFAGFRVTKKPRWADNQDIVSFLGASYFRAIDKNNQYGLSARGLAINTAANGKEEEFPAFTQFWFMHPAPGETRFITYALLDSPSATGAYRFDIDCQEERVVMGVQKYIYPRKSIDRLGIAPMTSMYLMGPSQAQRRDTIHPQIHDSDRLSMWRGNGEWVCRPLYNPQNIQYNAFADENLKGFGLLQTDHDFESYMDDQAWYSRRPSLWIEPTSAWGKGAINLIELPTVGEDVDNIVAFWVPEKPVQPNESLSFAYTLYWSPMPPVAPTLARVDKTYTGMGNVLEGWIPGDHSPKEYARRFAVNFKGGDLMSLPEDAELKPVVEASHGKVDLEQAFRFDEADAYRAIFDWTPESDSTEPVTLRMYLAKDGKAVSETWLYQWVPPNPDQRFY
ncbi:glucan biosynthesis protein [Larsenimonas salina]|uniref:glucan biosynthesis protein n=1 Tax=Larsenimonas salina TaxID=1295565 RepID=UPI002073DFB7|nr:glucan biosynthesis protein D [Larsenimonas salina]MCM5703825.1 glucan biosynthesis protein D [Larsenimonas salina]